MYRTFNIVAVCYFIFFPISIKVYINLLYMEEIEIYNMYFNM